DLASRALERITKDYISIAFDSAYLYHSSTTLSEEISSIWSQTWRTGKVLFLFIRYGVILLVAQSILVELRIQTVLSPQVCRGLYLSNNVVLRATGIASEMVVLLCLHALLGAKKRYLALLMTLYTGLTLGGLIPQYKYFGEISDASLISTLDRELGYACTWAVIPSDDAIQKLNATEYIAVVKSACTSALAIAVFYLRYRSQRGSLIRVVRRDSGLCIVSLTSTIRLGNAATNAFCPESTSYIPIAIFRGLQNIVVPILACRLLFNVRQRTAETSEMVVSTILFDPPIYLGDMSEDEDDLTEKSLKLNAAPYSGLGRLEADEV
ncbi:hypothetical protein DFP72DRAFT_926568, partial [Ephemerocybe angulata]